MSSTAAKSDDPTKSTELSKEEESTPHLGVLEEDDEFEEFPVQGERRLQVPCASLAEPAAFRSTDWDDSQTDLAHLGGVTPGAAKADGDKLWEDNWDDDDIEEDFSVQLRYAWRQLIPLSPVLTISSILSPGIEMNFKRQGKRPCRCNIKL
jgi:26 proteasome complex subunit DSS1